MKLSVFQEKQLLRDIDCSEYEKDLPGKTELFVGRDKDCFILLNDRKIPRKLAKLRWNKGQWTILGESTNSDILVNGITGKEFLLKNGDLVQLNQFVLHVKDYSATDVAKAVSQIATDDVAPIEEPQEAVEGEVISTSEEPSTEADGTSLENQQTSESNENFGVSESTEPFGEMNVESSGEMAPVDTDKTKEIHLGTPYLKLWGPKELLPFEDYLIADKQVMIGRDKEKCAIVLNEQQVSNVHAIIRRRGVECFFEDLKSANGSYFNDVRTNAKRLVPGDVFRIGPFNFSFEIKSDFLKNEGGRLMPVEKNQEIEIEEIVEVTEGFEQGTGEDVGPTKKLSFFEEIKSNPDKRKKVIIGLVVLAGLYFFLDDDKGSPDKKAKAAQAAKNAKKLPKSNATKEAVKSPFSPAQLEYLEASYQLSKELFDQGRYSDTIVQLQKILGVTKEYKNSTQLFQLAKQGLAKIEELERKRIEDIERKKRVERVKELVIKAKEATDKKEFALAQGLFPEILKLEPENVEVPQMKLEIDAYYAEEKRKEDEVRTKKETRQKMEDAISKPKNLYLTKQWVPAILALKEFLKIFPMDNDLSKEGSDMLADARKQLKLSIDPHLIAAHNFLEADDLKGAYDSYQKILRIDPNHEESLSEIGDIKDKFVIRARKVFADGLIAESLSLYDEAREKFQEVMEMSPQDSEYYLKASEKLKYYIYKSEK